MTSLRRLALGASTLSLTLGSAAFAQGVPVTEKPAPEQGTPEAQSAAD